MSVNYSVSVIIPAFNAAATLGEALVSLQSQTYPDWEAIVVDDGSSDETACIADGFAAADPRIRVIRQDNQGVCAARNRGSELAQYDWLLFLDSDDWIANDLLEKMMRVLASDTSLDVVYCGWTYVSPTGEHFQTILPKFSPDMFALLALECPYSIHGCINRKSLVAAVGGFDTTFSACEDWELWIRLARAGGKFAHLNESLAFYRMRPGSLSTNFDRMLFDGLRAMNIARTADPRVSNPDPKYASGYVDTDGTDKPFQFMGWSAGRLISEGRDACHLLDLIKDRLGHACAPASMAYALHSALPISEGCLPAGLVALRAQVADPLLKFLNELERRSGARNFVRRTLSILDRLILEQADFATPFSVGNQYGLCIDIQQPIDNLLVPPTAERLHVAVMLDGAKLGLIELPVIDGQVSALIVKDAIAEAHCWPILGTFFQQTLFAEQPQYNHDEQGWEALLQQVWNFPGVPSGFFYDANHAAAERRGELTCQVAGSCEVDIAQDLPDLLVAGEEIQVTATVAGCALCTVTLPVKKGRVEAHRLRVAITYASGIELCRVIVREALLGQSLSEGGSLRNRLQQALTLRKTGVHPFDHPEASAVIGRRNGPIDSSATRRYALPTETDDEIAQMVEACGEEFSYRNTNGSRSKPIFYLPEQLVLTKSAAPPVETQHRSAALRSRNQPAAQNSNQPNVRQHFELLFAQANDPWKYTSNYEQLKYEQTLSLIQATPATTALELACAEGHFTKQLAPRVGSLTSVDISKLALERAAERCIDLANIDFKQADFFLNPIKGKYDLITCSEVLYYVGGKPELLNVANKIAEALKPGGQLVMAHAFQTIDAPGEPGFDWSCPFGAKTIGNTFQSVKTLDLEAEIRTPLYAVQAFRRRKARRNLFQRRPIPKTEVVAEYPFPLPDDFAQFVRWKGETVSPSDEPPVVTQALPILMYHRVAATGADALSDYRVSPEQFEEQLEYLQGAGYYSVDWATWCSARLERKPLAGRAIALTFDDGYQDFYDTAWPLLKKYGFTATVFLVADHVGGVNEWDDAYREQVALMDWTAIRELHAEGVDFGSHTATHEQLTGLSTSDVVRQLARSRRILQAELGTPITTIAYPYGDCDASTYHLAGACGYQVGLTCTKGPASLDNALLSLPRIEVQGKDSLADFVRKL